jgi:ornithine carbamoyltransferase
MCSLALFATMPEPIVSFDAAMVLAAARDLHRAAFAHAMPPLLAGKHLCVLGPTIDGHDAHAFIDAARELAAQVSVLHPDQLALRTPAEVKRCAGLLGRLYDAVECQGVTADLVRDLREAADIPVYDAIAGDGHATAVLADRLEIDAPAALCRRRVLQAMLVGSLT